MQEGRFTGNGTAYSLTTAKEVVDRTTKMRHNTNKP